MLFPAPRRCGGPGVDLRLADAYDLPFADASFAGTGPTRCSTLSPTRPGRWPRRDGYWLRGGRAVLIGQDRDNFIVDAVVLGPAHSAREAGAITAGQAEEWTTEQARRTQDGTLFLAAPLFLAAGRGP
jgi:hypothetical protein